MPEYATRDLHAAALALMEYGKATKPELTQEGRKAALLTPLPGEMGFRLALCRNSLRGIAEAYEEQVQAEREAANPEPLAQEATAIQRTAWARATRAAARDAEAKIRDAGKVLVEWSPPATVRAEQLLDREIPEEWLAAWVAVGIIVPSGNGAGTA